MRSPRSQTLNLNAPHPAQDTQVSGYDKVIGTHKIGMPGRQRPGRSLPVHAQPDGDPADRVGFQRGEIVGHVIDQVQRRPGCLG